MRGGCLTVLLPGTTHTQIHANTHTHTCIHTVAQWPAAPLWRRLAAEEQKALFSRAQLSVKNTSLKVDERQTCSEHSCETVYHGQAQTVSAASNLGQENHWCSFNSMTETFLQIRDLGKVFKYFSFYLVLCVFTTPPRLSCTFPSTDKLDIIP